MATLLCCGGLLLVTARAAGSITSEKERDCWDSLISTPLDARDIVWGKFLGNFWALRGVLFTLAVIWLPALTLRPEFLVAIGFTLLIFAILVAFVAILGVHVSLRSKNSLRSLGTALAIGLFVGGGYLAFCCPLAEIGAHGSEQGLLVGLAPCMPFLVAVPGLFNAEVWSRDRSGTFIVAYVLGLIGYFFATVILYVWTVERFDELSERSVRRDYGEMKPRERPSL